MLLLNALKGRNLCRCPSAYPLITPQATAYLFLVQRPQLARSCSPTGEGSSGQVHDLRQTVLCRDPVTDFVHLDFDDGNTGVMNVAFVYAVLEVAEESRGPASRSAYTIYKQGGATHIGFQCFAISSLSWLIRAMPQYDAQFVVC